MFFFNIPFLSILFLFHFKHVSTTIIARLADLLYKFDISMISESIFVNKFYPDYEGGPEENQNYLLECRSIVVQASPAR